MLASFSGRHSSGCLQLVPHYVVDCFLFVVGSQRMHRPQLLAELSQEWNCKICWNRLSLYHGPIQHDVGNSLTTTVAGQKPDPRLDIKSLFRYGDSHYKDKTVVRPSYLYNGNPFTGTATSSYWDGPQRLNTQTHPIYHPPVIRMPMIRIWYWSSWVLFIWSLPSNRILKTYRIATLIIRLLL